MSTIQYNINSKWTSRIHLGKEINFNNKNSLQTKDLNDLLAGGSLIYEINPDFALGVEYGANPRDLFIINPPFSFNSFHTPYYLENVDHNNNLRVWLNKNFIKSKINILIHYQQYKNQYSSKD